MSPKSLIFLHIGKTGGTSLRHMLQSLFAEDEQLVIYERPPHVTLKDFRALSIDERRKIKLVCGHFPFGIHKDLPNPSTYVTLVRHPVLRVISIYYHHYTKPNENLYERIHKENISLRDFVTAGLDARVENGMTRVISGLRAPFGTTTEEMLDCAMDNIQEHFSLVGVTEYYEDSLLRLKAALPTHLPEMVRTNVTKSRMPLYNISDKDIEAIMELNALDIHLYEFAVKKLLNGWLFRSPNT
jgi:hypothetical protein